MTRDDTRDTLPEDRDPRVGSALGKLDVPHYPPDFMANVWARIDEETGKAPAAGTARTRPRRRLWTRRPLLAGVATAAIAAGVAAALLFGLPGASDKTGPPPVSAAAVVRIARTALASGQTLTADGTSESWLPLSISDVIVWPDAAPVVGEPIVRRYSLTLRNDGSYRETDVPRTLQEAVRLTHATYMATWGLVNDSAYDAASGVHTYYSRGYDAMMPQGKRVAVDAGVVTGCAPGPPDFWTDWSSGGAFGFGGFGGFLRALQAASGGDVRVGQYEGRPAWIVTCDLPVRWGWGEPDNPGVELKTPPMDLLVLTVDQGSGLPLRTQGWFGGAPVSDSRLENVRVGVTLSRDAFTVTIPADTRVYRHDMGFRTVSLQRAAAGVDYELVVPANVPEGYALSQVAVAPRDGTWKWGTPPRGTEVVALLYRHGFASLTVTTRRARRARQYSHGDAFGLDVGGAESHGFNMTGSRQGPVAVRLTSGAFAGVRAWTVTGPLVIPHLWAVKKGVLLTIAGAATADELVAMADSLSTYRGSEEAAP